MPRPLRLFLGLCTSLLLTQGYLFAGEPQWIEVRSQHFSVVTDAGEKRGRETALKFEQMRTAFGAMLAKANVNLPIPLQIVAFRNTKELRQFAPLWHGKPTQVAGLFQSSQDRNFILLDISAEDPWTVVFHEYAHELMNGNIKGETQPWFEEGYAEYFSTVQVDGKQIKLGYKPPPGDMEVLGSMSWMKVSDLFRVEHSSRTYNEGDRRSVFYAESWLVLHYLFSSQQVLKVANYLDAVDQKLSIEDAIQRSFGMSAAQFDKALHDYYSGHMRYFTIPAPNAQEPADFSTTSISSADAKAELADVHLHSVDYLEQSVKEFEAVLAMDPQNGAALRGLGYAALRKRELDRAGDYFRKAVQHDSNDPRVYYYSALLGNQEDSSFDQARLNEIKSDLQKSIALDPNFADAHAQLAYACMRSGQQDAALASLKKALELSPRNEQYLFNLSQVYLASGKVDDAVAILQPLTNSPNPEAAARARQSMQQVGKMQSVLSALKHSEGKLTKASTSESVSTPVTSAGTENDVPPLPPATPPKFLKGELISVDCSHAPAAVLTVNSGAKMLKMKVPDTKNVAVIGADTFSCEWTRKKVALNYHDSPDGMGDVMSVEIQ